MNEKEKQAEQLLAMIQELNKRNATTEDVTNIFTKALEATASVKDQLTKQIKDSKGESTVNLKKVLSSIKGLENQIMALGKRLTDTKEILSEETSKALKEIYKELKRLESSMPQMPDVPDLAPLEVRLSAIESKPATETITVTEVHEIVQEATDNYPAITVSASQPKNPKFGDIWIGL